MANDNIAQTELLKLRDLVEFSRRHRDQLDWQKNLNEWLVLFVLHILQLLQHIPNMIPAKKQQPKIVESLEKM